ncbi:MAG TPA: ERF family protein [Planctomycetota bacterium]|nr:ERF family protein [Planctomycetota bacterium]
MNDERKALTMTLAARLVSVIAETGAVPKAGFNQQQNYRYSTIGDVLEMVRGNLARNGVLLLMMPGNPEFAELTRGEGKAPMIACRLTVVFRFADALTGESLEIAWLAEGQDVGDKAVAKALAAAQKTFLVRTFLLPSLDDDPDAPPSGGAARPRTNTGPARTPPAGVDPNTGEVRVISEKQLKMIRGRLADAGIGESVACEQFHLLGLEELTNPGLDQVLAWMQTRRKTQ